jgi:hypothetical protein
VRLHSSRLWEGVRCGRACCESRGLRARVGATLPRCLPAEAEGLASHNDDERTAQEAAACVPQLLPAYISGRRGCGALANGIWGEIGKRTSERCCVRCRLARGAASVQRMVGDLQHTACSAVGQKRERAACSGRACAVH